VSFGAGLLVGVIYWALRLDAPAPIPVALVGLLGIVAGESGTQLLVRRIRARRGRQAVAGRATGSSFDGTETAGKEEA
jgi:XapX domain-containing protein